MARIKIEDANAVPEPEEDVATDAIEVEATVIDEEPSAGASVAGAVGDMLNDLHEQGKATRASMRTAARDMGAKIMDDAKDFTAKAADAAGDVAQKAADFGARAASGMGKGAGEAAAAAAAATKEGAQVAAQAASTVADAAGKAAAAASEAAAGAAEVAQDAASELAEKAQAEAKEWQDRFMRLHAEWDTYRRRTAEQRAEEKSRASEGLVEALLPVLDDFERSIDYAVENGEAGLLDGVKQVHAKMVGVLEKNGVEVIDPVGEPFDALEHQAVAKVQDADAFDETVKSVYQKGYKMGKKVIRPATVTVTEGGPARPKEDAPEDKAPDEAAKPEPEQAEAAPEEA